MFVGFPEGFYKTKKTLGKTKNTKETKENQNNIRENHKKNKVVKGFRPTLGCGFVLFVCFPDGFLQNQKNIRENQKYKRKPKKTNKIFGKTRKNNVFKGFRPTLGYGCLFLFVVFVGFPEGFYKTKKTLGKTKNTKENQRKPKKTSGKPKKTKCLKVSDPPLDMGLVLVVFLVFPKVFTKPTKPSRKPKIPKKTKQNKTKQKTFGKTRKNKVVKGFRPTLGYGFVLYLLVFPKVFTKPKKH